ncbi:CPBP family intramembrane glutamic endopeptidase [Enterococcus rivorum]|uniref:CAAX prenyl protease 2/Lysostaphin resistance protein A-like domain-containing protein n=1 Tax=Enterococcus rivorum TaxID=762845 RepID=A0A1E5KSK3_9ENTE|nr:CPBP family intramembrane glutamic endopeptidase [Enterococcus rivorum]MBP2098247.1 membrane protease YdiL (CAAX protease family) [Enterococcus rivorum]OEH80833.1 hypothetical protein BCR26_06270 [Enterococcus rivorum]
MLEKTSTSSNDASLKTTFQGVPLWIILLTVAVLPGIIEEIIFRAGIMHTLFSKHDSIGVIINSVLFGALHMPATLLEFAIYFLMGLVFSVIFLKSKQLEISILVHISNNLLATIGMF